MQNGVEALTVLFLDCNTETLMWVSVVRPKSAASSFPGGSVCLCVRHEGPAVGLTIAVSFELDGLHTASLPSTETKRFRGVVSIIFAGLSCGGLTRARTLLFFSLSLDTSFCNTTRLEDNTPRTTCLCGNDCFVVLHRVPISALAWATSSVVTCTVYREGLAVATSTCLGHIPSTPSAASAPASLANTAFIQT